MFSGVTNNPTFHRHKACSGKIAVVHNGIIENFEELREELKKEGHKFVSDTDTEVLPHLLEKYYEENGDLQKALDIFRKIAQSDFGYKDVSQRVNNLRNKEQKPTSQ